VLASYQVVSNAAPSTTGAALEIANTDSFVNIGENLSTNKVNDLAQLITTYSQAFSTNGELGCTPALEHDIELVEGAKPFSEPLRRRPLKHQEETRRQVEEMLKKGIIEES